MIKITLSSSKSNLSSLVVLLFVFVALFSKLWNSFQISLYKLVKEQFWAYASSLHVQATGLFKPQSLLDKIDKEVKGCECGLSSVG